MTREAEELRSTRRATLQLVGVTPVFGYLRGEEKAPRRSVTTGTLPLPARSLWGSRVSVAVSESSAVVGLPPSSTPGGRDAGSVALFTRGGAGWRRETTVPSPQQSSQFGAAVALEGDTAVVGAPLGGVGESSLGGSATVLTRRGGGWTETTALQRTTATGVDGFGGAVAVDGDTIAVGAETASTERGFRTGATEVYARVDGSWTPEATLSAPAGVDQFGTSVALSGGTVVVGARCRGDGGPQTAAGAAFVFTRDGDEWRRVARLTAPEGGREDGFGAAVALDGDTLLVGAPTETNGGGANAGAAYVFTRGKRGWRHAETLKRGHAAPDDQFGATVAVDGDGALVGHRATVAPAVFGRANGRWRERPRRHPGVGRLPGRTNTAVALAGGTALVGASGSTDSPETHPGGVLVLES